METVSQAPKLPLNCERLLRNSFHSHSNNMPPTCKRTQSFPHNHHLRRHTQGQPPASHIPNLTCKRENSWYNLIFSFSFFPLLAEKKYDFSNLWQPSLLQDLVHLKTCGKPSGMFQMTPRCGPQTGLTHSLPTQRQGGGIKEASPGESLSNIKKRLSLSVDFCYFQSIRAHWSVA